VAQSSFLTAAACHTIQIDKPYSLILLSDLISYTLSIKGKVITLFRTYRLLLLIQLFLSKYNLRLNSTLEVQPYEFIFDLSTKKTITMD